MKRLTKLLKKNPGSDFGIDTWGNYSEEWPLNPDDSEAWEWTDIDALQIGIALKRAQPTCFLSGTEILLANHSSKAIENVKVGDIVKSYNEKTGGLENSRVEAVFNI
ncbi:unnamed protein product, partial [marine sediment metagenome]